MTELVTVAMALVSAGFLFGLGFHVAARVLPARKVPTSTMEIGAGLRAVIEHRDQA